MNSYQRNRLEVAALAAISEHERTERRIATGEFTRSARNMPPRDVLVILTEELGEIATLCKQRIGMKKGITDKEFQAGMREELTQLAAIAIDALTRYLP